MLLSLVWNKGLDIKKNKISPFEWRQAQSDTAVGNKLLRKFAGMPFGNPVSLNTK